MSSPENAEMLAFAVGVFPSMEDLANYPFFSLPSVLPKLSDVSLWIAETDRYQGTAYS